MKFEKYFTRRVGEGDEKVTLLEDDQDPTELERGEASKAYLSRDNVLKCRMTSINGWPVQRVCVGLDAPDADAELEAAIFVYDREDQVWYRLQETRFVLEHRGLVWFDCPVLIDTVSKDSTLHSNATIELALVLRPRSEGQPSGVYRIAMAPDLSSGL